MKRLVLFGGTFDPVHNAHLRIARFASNKLNATVMFLPAKHPRWKAPHASINDRYEMIRLALKDEKCPSLILSDYEIKRRDKINYTINTIKHFKKVYPNSKLYLLIGADQVSSFDRWQDAPNIAKLCQIIYVDRPDIKIEQKNVKRFKMQSLEYHKSGVASSHSIRHLAGLDTTPSVIKYIEEHHLYYIKTLEEKYYEPKRFIHALSVANLAYTIALKNHLKEPDLYYLAGLLHDIGKKTSPNNSLKIMQKYFKEYINDVPIKLYHQFVGAYLAKEKLGVNRQEVIDAIKYHASGRDNMSDIEKVVYVSDKIDPTRGFDSSKLIRACVNNIEKGFVIVLKANKEYLKKKNLSFNNSLTKKCFKFYLKKVG